MNLQQYKEIVTETILNPMRSFLEEWDDCEYTADDIDTCGALLNQYLESLAAMSTPSDKAIMEQVKSLVLALNDLNEALDYALIETEERESIWHLIQTSAIACGLQEYTEDITEEWREW